MADLSLSQKAARSSLWVFGLRVSSQLLFLIRTIVLARLLSPEDFGLFAIVLLSIGFLQAVSEPGVNKALVQQKEDIRAYLNTAWTIQIGRNILLAAILYGAAYYIADFFSSPELVKPLQAMCAAILVAGFNNIGIIYFQKELKFDQQFKYQLTGLITEMIVSIGVALILKSVWALITGQLAGSLARLIMSYQIHSFRPQVVFRKKNAKVLLGFGKWVLMTNILNYFVVNLDNMVVGKVLGSTKLGLFQMAFRLSNMMTTEITHVASQVAFPSFAKLQDRRATLKNAFLLSMRSVALLSLPAAGGLYVLTPEIVNVILGPKWSAIVPILKLLCVIGAIRSITANFGPLFLSIGRPDIQTKASFFNLCLLSITIYPMVNAFGMIGAVYARLITLLSQVYIWPQMARVIDVQARTLAAILLPPCIATGFMVVTVAALKMILAVNMANLILLITAGIMAYGICLFGIDYIGNCGVYKNIQHIVQSIK